ncbi:PD-(D/E)XK nuclease family transposase [Candidatus Cyrtobacter comes]|uniref:PD-(D/E)XK nuclease family transposase n=2 Tax=Candidatus Cyrtobacter comes TaxID=675776 RepID=A0ABU5L916_9RICK|nr:PD-(D/E)XK nuclease family transposase [Candidatus Cyrtobacter comes]
MASRYLDVTNDLAFKKVFSDKDIMKDFLNSILHLSNGSAITEIEFIPTEEVPDLGQNKRSIFDLKCRDQDGNWFVVEMQNRKQEHFLERVQFYASHTYVAQLPKGKSHKGLMPVILIAISKENLFPDEIGCVSYHKTKEDQTNKQHLFALSYVFIELGKFNKTAQELYSTEDYWLYFLAESEEIKQPPSSIKDHWVLKAYETIERFNWNDIEYDGYIRAKLLAEAEEMTLQDNLQKATMKGIERGREEGIEQGRNAEKLIIAKNLLSLGIDKKKISESTGLSLKEIEGL